MTRMISVIIPSFNEEENIAQCLVSLSHQTVNRTEYEIIVVDGGSTDRTCEIARKYADMVFIQTSKKVGGATKRRSHGIKRRYHRIDRCRLHPPAGLDRARSGTILLIRQSCRSMARSTPSRTVSATISRFLWQILSPVSGTTADILLHTRLQHRVP